MKPAMVLGRLGVAACVSLFAWSGARAEGPAAKAKGLIERVLHNSDPATDDAAVRNLFSGGDDHYDSLAAGFQAAPEVPAPTARATDQAAAAPNGKPNCPNGAPEEPAPEPAPGLLMQMFDKHCCGLKEKGIKVYGWLEQGYTFNPDSPDNRLNFGRLFDDRSNDYRFNQLVLRIEKPTETGDKWDTGFMIDLLYGSDARFIHAVDLLDNTFDENTVQFDPIQFYGVIHAPWLTQKGMDISVGRMVTLQGYEVIAATGNPLYSHSYIFNFGIPFSHTSLPMVNTYLGDNWVLKTGLVNGINTFGDNNDHWAFHGGLNYVPAEGKLNVFNSIHAGPENPDNNDDWRVIVSSQPVIKWTDKLTQAHDLNAGWDALGPGAEWYGIANYLIYALSEKYSLVLRYEVFRDDDGFAVATFPENDDFANVLRGAPNTALFGGATTYQELTLGVNIRPYGSLIVRPEVRWDWVCDSVVTPFDDFSDSNQFTLGCDVIWTF